MSNGVLLAQVFDFDDYVVHFRGLDDIGKTALSLAEERNTGNKHRTASHYRDEERRPVDRMLTPKKTPSEAVDHPYHGVQRVGQSIVLRHHTTHKPNGRN